MKKIVFVMPFMAISLLASCGCSKSGPTYTIAFNCTDCKAYNENDKEVRRVKVPVIKSVDSLYRKFHFKGNLPSKVPLKSDISIKKTGTNEIVEYKYVNGNIYVPVVGNLTITARGSSYSKSLENSSWDEINEISATEKADDFFDVGDTKEIKLVEDGVEQSFSHTVRIIDFNHDDLADGSGKKAGITFEFENLITKSNKTDSNTTYWDSTNNYYYRDSVINNFLNDETDGAESIINLLPDDLNKEGIIKPVDKLVGSSFDEGQNYTAISIGGLVCPKLFPLAYDEVHVSGKSNVTPGEAGNAGIYKYYEGHSGDTSDDMTYRVKKTVGGSNFLYWLRSPDTNTNYRPSAFIISTDGTIGSLGVHEYQLAVAPAFCI